MLTAVNSPASTKKAPITAGMLISREYFTANFRLRPQKRPALIVRPNLERPGSTEIPWHIPIHMASPKFASRVPLLPFILL